MVDNFLGRIELQMRQCVLYICGPRMGLLVIRIAQSFLDVRVMGLAAEMTYYALLSIFPLIGALGASLGFLERIIGPKAIEQVEVEVVASLNEVFRTEITTEVLAPMVQGLLRQTRTGFAIGGFLMALFLASRVFRSAILTLNAAYQVEDRRGVAALWGLGFLFAFGAIVTATVMLGMVVVGPLLGGGRAIAEGLGFGAGFEIGWAIARWPTIFVLSTGFLVVLYKIGPDVHNTWRQSLPGALFGMVAMLLVSVGFRVYLENYGFESIEIHDANVAVTVGAQMIGVMFGTLLWLWLNGIILLIGGVVNAELSRKHRDRV